MKQMNTQQNQTQIIAQIVAHVSGSSIETVRELIARTNEISSCKLVSLRGYSSDATDNTEVANHVVNFGAVYENMKVKDAQMLAEVNVDNVNIDNYNYTNIDFNGRTIDEYKALVRVELPIALAEMREAANRTTPVQRVNNDVWLNNVLVFNNNTNSLCVFGQSISKTVEVEAEEKTTKKKAKTVAKDLIRKHVAQMRESKGLPTGLIRRFKIANLNSIKINGTTIEIG